VIMDVEEKGHLRGLRGQPAKGVSGAREVRHEGAGQGLG
jgi:hypothetical protein